MAMNGAALQAFHADPFDRLIVATAQGTAAKLVSADEKLIAFSTEVGIKLLEL